MATTLREKILVRQYSTAWNVIQALVTIGANTKTTITVTPPTGKTFVVSEVTVGPQAITNNFTAQVYVDGTQWQNLVSNGALEGHFKDDAPILYSINNIVVFLDNTDTIPHTTDFLFTGFLVENGRLEEFLEELSGRKQIRLLESIDLSLRKLSGR